MTPKRGSGLHHVEVWVAELDEALPRWSWLFEVLGWMGTAAWPDGRTWSADTGPYVTLTTPPTVTDETHDRRRPGVNHLAFHGGAPADVDDIMAAAARHGWRTLYGDRYPHAGGPGHYAGWLEDVTGFKVEIVADPDASPSPAR